LVEIILKKIEEVGNIAENFRKPEPIYRIDIDLALSKVRSLYNELSVLSHRSPEPYTINNEVPAQEEATVVPEMTDTDDSHVNGKVAEDTHTVREALEDASIAEHKQDSEDNMSETFELVDEPESSSDTEVITEKETEHADSNIIPEDKDRTEPEGKPQEKKTSEKKGKGHERKAESGKRSQPTLFDITSGDTKIIADRYKKTSQSVNEMIARFKKETDLATQLKYKPVSDIKSAISLNDKIMFIRELFNEDADKCNKVLDHLNKMKNLDEAMAYLNENFDWNDQTESFRKFIELVYRRFLNK
ncbi:MAG: hypothetical protein KJ607_10390, partial [Bacteroidetes bacterium]|nr:hypothetical protein [Bacteroidota bacterium]